MTYSVDSHVTIYAWRDAIYSFPLPSEYGQGAALTFIRRLNEGDVDAAVECAKWVLENKSEETFNVNLGPMFYLHVQDRTVRDMEGKVVWKL